MVVNMNNLNYVFFDTFANLDKLCGQLYNKSYGVTHYIDDMKVITWNDYRHIPNWEADLQTLIRLRHIRNTLAHEPSAFQYESCSQADIDGLEYFHKRILNRTDPMALLHKQLATPKPSPKYANISSHYQNDSSSNKEPFSWWTIFLLAAGFVLAIIAIGIILY